MMFLSALPFSLCAALSKFTPLVWTRDPLSGFSGSSTDGSAVLNSDFLKENIYLQDFVGRDGLSVGGGKEINTEQQNMKCNTI